MWKIPIQFLAGREGTGFMELNNDRFVLRLTDQAGVEIVQDRGYSYETTGDAEYVEAQEDAPPEDTTPVYGTVMTKHAFRNRFTVEEKTAVEFAAVDISDAPTEQRQLAAALRSYLRDLDLADSIDIGLPEVRAGLEFLETVQLLAAGTADRVCDAPLTADEVYR